MRCGLAWCFVGERTSDLERVFEAAAPWVKVMLPGVMTDIAQGEVVVVSFNRLAEWHASLAARSLTVLVIDEAPLIRNA